MLSNIFKRRNIFFLLVLFFMLIGITILLNHKGNERSHSQIKRSSMTVSEHKENHDLILNHGLTVDSIKNFTVSRWEGVLGSQIKVNPYCTLEPANLVELEDEFVYTEIIEPIYYKDSIYSIKNTYVIPKSFQSKQYIDFTRDSRFDAVRRIGYYFQNVIGRNISSEVVEIEPEEASEHQLNPIFSGYNIICYSEVKEYDEGQDNYKSVLTSNALLVDYYYLEQGITSDGDIIMKLHDIYTEYQESEYYSDIGAVVALYRYGKSNRRSLITELKLYDNHMNYINELIRTPKKYSD